jgi:hypothetical protein
MSETTGGITRPSRAKTTFSESGYPQMAGTRRPNMDLDFSAGSNATMQGTGSRH